MPDINLSREWVCNGRELKPKNGASSNETWTFNGREI